MNQHPPTVFVIQQPRPKADGWTPNLETAREFGRLEFVFDSGDRPYADPKGAAAKVAARLKHFDPKQDFLLWANFGDPASVWVTIMVLMLTHRVLRFLYWSRGKQGTMMTNENGFYFPVEINLA